ncbi:bifunctional 2',3'-cyclic-nucleotide 2'-phosphodiesterase/3'-nucleotidase [Paraliobacillus salinarum]|uniref:bifunctional 2',3'-cyclic-nucleotide 2'-phosphodiesterase/3'-nucleotidase n=1 Tax=Paraliobacillus salinarum TaxID=1158996 RepID=UPI001FEC1912|nr:bifunctional 2',3'-cyclic-nucleotide 2'-phosphodiesterase/3'-nucleotidase [Paraliobacillus salinarum]
MKKLGIFKLLLLIVLVILPISVSAANDDVIVDLRLMETTDIHSHVMNYDYFSGSQDETIGLVNVATLVNKVRAEHKNTLLFDNGDLIQGNPMADYIVNENVLDQNNNVHPVYKVMNLLQYDAANFGNHEFNYGLEFLQKAVSGSDFPYVNANVYKDNGKFEENYFNPYVILDKEVTDQNGNKHTIKVGVIGFTPPKIMVWDKSNLEGKVITRDLKETADEFVPKMKAEGADVIVGIPHSGLGSINDYTHGAENATYELSKVKDMDALLFGHSHQAFPSDYYASLDGKHNIDLEKGTINGVQTVQAGFWGSHLGIADLKLKKTAEGWDVVGGQSIVEPIYDSATDKPLVEPDQEAIDLVKDDHEGTKNYVSTPVGKTEVPLFSYFAQVMDDPTVQIVSDAQLAYINKYIQGTEFEDLPVLSAAAPFKAGRDGVSDYTDIPAGGLAIKDTTSLYKYPNTVRAAKLTGAQVIDWLEWSAGQFYQIDPTSDKPQELVDTKFRSYNFDVMDGLTYEVDVTVPPKYTADGELINPDSNRIVNVKHNEQPIDTAKEFLVVTNNHRATSKFANPDGNNIVIESPDETRQVLINYISGHDSINPQADNNWSFASIDGSPELIFRSAPGGEKYAANMDQIEFVKKRDDGYADFKFSVQNNEIPNKEFPDVPEGHWAKEAINRLFNQGIIKGYETGNFEPKNEITRAHFAMLLVRALELEGEATHPFSDLSGYAEAEVALAYEHGLVKGYPDGTFKPDVPIKREAIAAMMLRAYNVKNNTTYLATEDYHFSDEKEIAPYFDDAVDAVYELELMEGMGNNIFAPKNNSTRAEAATAVDRLLP